MDIKDFSLQASSNAFDIVDTQVHVGLGMIDSMLGAMNALGIRSILIDEFWGRFRDIDNQPTHIEPGFPVGNGGWRAVSPTAEQASMLHPDRFSYLVRIDRLDPQLENLMRLIAESPAARAFRLQPAWTLEETRAFRDGAYDALFDIAQDTGLPVCIFIPGFVELLPRYLKKYPRLNCIVDHCGMGFPGIPKGRSTTEEQRSLSASYFDEVLKLSVFPNLFLKWSHTQDRFNVTQYPYDSLRPLLRQAITAFGADRIMWASDNTVMFGHTWADLLYSLRDDPELSREEKRWVLGRTARNVLKWQASAESSTPVHATGH